MAQTDREGNVNVSKFGPKLAGAGGFINISQCAKTLVFVGTFTAGKPASRSRTAVSTSSKTGRAAKFVDQVEHRTYSGAYAAAKGQPVLYVTERCVFRLRPDGLELIEIAPGVDLERDILARMDFRPIMERPPRLMDERIFRPEPMGLRRDLLGVTIEERLSYDPRENLFFVNFERLAIHTSGRHRGGARRRQRPPGAPGPQGGRHRQLRPLQHPPGPRRRIHRHGRRSLRALLRQGHPLHHQHLHAAEARPRPVPAQCRPAHL